MQKILPALAFIATSFTASAQAIIPFVGANSSAYTVRRNNYSSHPVPGLNVGAVADIRLSSMFSLQPGLQYTLSGGKLTYIAAPSALMAARYEYRVSTLNLPVQLVFKTGEEDAGRFFAGAGFYAAANIGGNLTIETVGGTIGQSHDTRSLHIGSSEKNDVKSFDFGLNIGAGYHLTNGLEFYAFYQNGFTDILTGYYETDSRSYQAGLAVRYALKFTGSFAKHRAHSGRSNNLK